MAPLTRAMVPQQHRGILVALQRRLGAAGLVLVACVLLQLRRIRRKLPSNVPIWKPHWLFGQLPELLKAAARKEHLLYFDGIFKQLGVPTYAVWSFTSNHAVATMDRRNVEYILKTNFRNYPKGPIMRAAFDDLLGSGIFNADGDEWYRQRKTTSHMFTANLFKEHIWVVVRRNAQKVKSILQAAKPGEIVDMFNLMNRFTLDSIGEIGFGRDIGSLEDPTTPFLDSFDYAQQLTATRLRTPFWQLFAWLGVERERRFQEHLKRLNEFSRSVVRQLLKSIEAQSGETNGVSKVQSTAHTSFVGLFIEDAKKRGEHYSEEFLRDLVLNFVIAGRDTTAQCLSWTFYCLANNPEAEAKAREEIRAVCSAEGPTYEDIRRLPYLNAVLSEGLRLHPSVPLELKHTLEADTWPDGTIVPAGTRVMYNIWCMNRDKSVWGEDAGTFRPERWLEMETPPDSYTFPVFNAGPRECLGKRLAMVEMQTLLATVLPHVSLRLAIPASEVTPDCQLTLGMASGLPCTVQPMGAA